MRMATAALVTLACAAVGIWLAQRATGARLPWRARFALLATPAFFALFATWAFDNGHRALGIAVPVGVILAFGQVANVVSIRRSHRAAREARARRSAPR